MYIPLQNTARTEELRGAPGYDQIQRTTRLKLPPTAEHSMCHHRSDRLRYENLERKFTPPYIVYSESRAAALGWVGYFVGQVDCTTVTDRVSLTAELIVGEVERYQSRQPSHLHRDGTWMGAAMNVNGINDTDNRNTGPRTVPDWCRQHTSKP